LKKNGYFIFEKLKAELFSEILKVKFRVSQNHFTRNRKQSFPILLLFMLNLLRKSLSLEIENFTKSAFVQARMKIKPAVFEHLSHTLVNEVYTDNDTAIKLWNNFRLLAVDGSRITLPFTKEVKKRYGEVNNKNKTGVIKARCPVLYDAGHKYVLEGKPAPLKQGERALAITHLSHCKKQDLLIYDRGYPSYAFIKGHIKNDLSYLMRVKVSFNQQIIDFDKSKKETTIVEIFSVKYTKNSKKLTAKNAGIKVRLVSVKLPKNQIEILRTSL